METQAKLLLAGMLLPLISFVVLAFFGSRLAKPRAGYVAVGAIAGSFVCAAITLLLWRSSPVPGTWTILDPWATIGSVDVDFGVRLDSLTVIMFLMVTLVATCIFVFSLGYMSGHSDEVDGQCKYHRFFCYLSLFAFSMLGLLIAPSLLFLFIFWELVGVCSYLLIGFYFHKKSASSAAIKAFVVNRVGDFGFIIGLMIVFSYLGDISLDGAAAKFAALDSDHALFGPGPLGVSIATWMGICLFCGAMGKSAQVPLQVWLPDAMEGPTPVSALIHAATMVAAGVYLVARIFTLLTPGAALFIATVGCITLTLAALIAIVQTDIKRVLAYSTVSQLGYMIFGLGVGAWVGAMFHLLTHAFFKALMFLGSGQVIEGCHHEQDMTKMGGLRKKMPVTCWTFLIGVLAIAGTGIPGLGIGLGGYFSKDEILAVAWHRTRDHEQPASVADDGERLLAMAASESGTGQTRTDAAPGAPAPAEHARIHSEKLPQWLFILPVIVAYITPFYMMRCWWMTFMGKPRDEHVYEHAHESKLMVLPLIVLAVGTVFASYFLFRPMVAAAHPTTVLVDAFDGHAHDAAHAHGTLLAHGAHSAMIGWVGFAFVVGFGIAFVIYRNGLGLATTIKQKAISLHTVLWHKFYFDEVYNTVFLKGVSRVLANISAAFDKYFVDVLVNLVGSLTKGVAYLSGLCLDMNGMHGQKERKPMGVVSLLIVVAAAVAAWKIDAGAYSTAIWVGILVWVVLGVDGLVGDLGRLACSVGDTLRRPQTGHIRNYVLWVATAAVVAVLVIVWLASQPPPAVALVMP